MKINISFTYITYIKYLYQPIANFREHATRPPPPRPLTPPRPPPTQLQQVPPHQNYTEPSHLIRWNRDPLSPYCWAHLIPSKRHLIPCRWIDRLILDPAALSRASRTRSVPRSVVGLFHRTVTLTALDRARLGRVENVSRWNCIMLKTSKVEN